MANNFYCRTVLTGGGSGALDAIDGSSLNDLDFAVVSVLNKVYMYTLDNNSAAAEDSPNIISPDANAGDKRWILQGINIPSENDAVTPTLSFGDNDTGFYESAANVLSFAANGSASNLLLSISKFSGQGFRIPLNESPSATNPIYTLRGASDDLDTGIGLAALDQLSLIAGGVEGIRISEVNGTINVTITDNLNLISFESTTVYFEGSAVFN